MGGAARGGRGGGTLRHASRDTPRARIAPRIAIAREGASERAGAIARRGGASAIAFPPGRETDVARRRNISFFAGVAPSRRFAGGGARLASDDTATSPGDPEHALLSDDGVEARARRERGAELGRRDAARRTRGLDANASVARDGGETMRPGRDGRFRGGAGRRRDAHRRRGARDCRLHALLSVGLRTREESAPRSRGEVPGAGRDAPSGLIQQRRRFSLRFLIEFGYAFHWTGETPNARPGLHTSLQSEKSGSVTGYLMTWSRGVFRVREPSKSPTEAPPAGSCRCCSCARAVSNLQTVHGAVFLPSRSRTSPRASTRSRCRPPSPTTRRPRRWIASRI